jgi:hypothetical protein
VQTHGHRRPAAPTMRAMAAEVRRLGATPKERGPACRTHRSAPSAMIVPVTATTFATSNHQHSSDELVVKVTQGQSETEREEDTVGLCEAKLGERVAARPFRT